MGCFWIRVRRDNRLGQVTVKPNAQIEPCATAPYVATAYKAHTRHLRVCPGAAGPHRSQAMPWRQKGLSVVILSHTLCTITVPVPEAHADVDCGSFYACVAHARMLRTRLRGRLRQSGTTVCHSKSFGPWGMLLFFCPTLFPRAAQTEAWRYEPFSLTSQQHYRGNLLSNWDKLLRLAEVPAAPTCRMRSEPAGIPTGSLTVPASMQDPSVV